MPTYPILISFVIEGTQGQCQPGSDRRLGRTEAAEAYNEINRVRSSGILTGRLHRINSLQKAPKGIGIKICVRFDR